MTGVELADAIRRRRTVRRYDADSPVAPDDLDGVLAAGLRTGSAGHTQAVELLVLTDGDDRDRFWALTVTDAPDRWVRGMSAAPVLVLVWTSEDAYRRRYAEPDKGWPLDSDAWSAPYWWVDAGLVVQNLLLAATAAGLACAFVGVPRASQAAVATAFGVPGDRRSVGLVTLGHAAADASIRPPRRPRGPVAAPQHHGAWGHGDADPRR